MTLSLARRVSLCLLDGLIVIFTVISVIEVFFNGGEGNMVFTGFNGFRYFTIDSNILLGLVMLIGLKYRIRALKDPFIRFPLWLRALRLAAVVSTGLTFLTVVAFLGPLMGYAMMYSGSNLFMHLLSPLMGYASFLLSCREPMLKPWHILTSILPTLIYGAFYCSFTLTGVWEDFYCFNLNGMLPLTAVIIITVVLGQGYLLSRLTGGKPLLKKKEQSSAPLTK